MLPDRALLPQLRGCLPPAGGPAACGTLDAVFVLDLPGGRKGVLGVDVKYHDWLKPETPRPENLRRYLQVAERSGTFLPGRPTRSRTRTSSR
jgi:hypothetical protein